MDEEDLAEKAEAEKLQTNQDFAGFGGTDGDASWKGNLMDLFRSEGETMGIKLLKRMGWREGQGIGPRVRRQARFEDDASETQAEHTFAPDDTEMPQFEEKQDRKGLGFEAGERLTSQLSRKAEEQQDDEAEDEPFTSIARPAASKPATKPRKGGFGMGVLNDTGSDDEDPYAVGPRISYNKVIGGDKKKPKPKVQKPTSTTSASSNPLLRTKPVFKSAKSNSSSSSSGFRKCHDGRLPLTGFLLSTTPPTTTDDAEKCPTPEVPAGWTSAKAPSSSSTTAPQPYQSTADTARASTLDPKSRAALLGELSLPGKSVFDYLTPATRSRLATASGRSDLPAAGSEALPAPKPEEINQEDLPQLDKHTAAAALGRGTQGWMPYAEDVEKRARYRGFLEYHAGIREALPERAREVKSRAWVAELREFAHAARVFRPVQGAMASRFQSSSAGALANTGSDTRDASGEKLQRTPKEKVKDPAEEAAEMGMFGPLTRKVLTFYPSRLACKRFGVKVPAHVNSSNEGMAAHGAEEEQKEAAGTDITEAAHGTTRGADMGHGMGLGGGMAMKSFSRGGVEHADQQGVESQGGMRLLQDPAAKQEEDKEPEAQSAERNEALEAKRAGDELFKAVFGDDSD